MMENEDEIYTIELNKKQLMMVADTLELVSRMLSGQLTVSTIYPFRDILYEQKNKNNIDIKREKIEEHLREIKKILFPSLHFNASHGIGYNDNSHSDHLYEMYKQIRHLLQRENEMNGKDTPNVHSGVPLRLTKNPLIVVRNAKELTRNKRIDDLLDE